MAPGLRLGWITSTPAFRAHLVKFIDLSTQHPSGFPQALIAQLLSPSGGGWSLDGFDRWVHSLGREYQRRRDLFLALFAEHVASTGLADADAPEAGMFVWIRVHVERHPRFVADVRADGDAAAAAGPDGAKTNTAALMRELLDACIAAGLLICPASMFILDAEPEDSVNVVDVSVPARPAILLARPSKLTSCDQRCHFVRGTFAGAEETMTKGLPILGKVLKEFFAA